MASIRFDGTPASSVGELPAVGSRAPDFRLVGSDFADRTLANYRGKKKILNIFPSVATGVCAASVRSFHERAAGRADTVVLNVSADLPFAHARFCAAEGLEGVETLSTLRGTFGRDYGVTFADSAWEGLMTRAVVVLDEGDHVLHTEQVPEIGQEPDYDAALAALG